MMSLKPRLLFLTLLLLACTLPSAAMANEQRSVRSLLEIRQDNVVMQEWDLSCGAATLTTLLNYQHGDLVTEKEVATALMNRDIYIDNPLLVEEDGAVYQMRRWYQQFYVDVADITPEMTDRFELEVDTTRANEKWNVEVEENLRRRAAREAGHPAS